MSSLGLKGVRMAESVVDKWQAHHAEAGGVKPFVRALISGWPKAGKSYLLAGFPSPVLALDYQERGLSMYLRKDEGDQCYTLDSPAQVEEFCNDFAPMLMKGEFKSFVIDSSTLWWEDTIAAAKEKRGGDVTVSDWDWIKKPLKKIMRRSAFALPCHFGMTSWVRDIELESEEERLPGQKPRMKVKSVRKVNRAATEKRVPHFVDFWYECSALENGEGQPSGEHEVTFVGGRIPPAVPREMLYFGKSWKFGDNPRSSPAEVWDSVMGWLPPFITQGGVPLLVGMDAEDDQEFWRRAMEEASDEKLGKIARKMREATTIVAYRLMFERELQALSMGLTAAGKTEFARLHELRKKELGG